MHLEYEISETSLLKLVKHDTKLSFELLKISIETDEYDTDRYWDTFSFALAKIIPDIIAALKDEQNRIVMYADGPLAPEELLAILPYICNFDSNGAYHIFEQTKKSGPGYVHGSISYEFIEDWLRKMLKDEEMPFQGDTEFAGVVVPDNKFVDALEQHYLKRSLRYKLLEYGDIFFETDRDFLVFNIYSRTLRGDEILEKIRKALPQEMRIEKRKKKKKLK